MKRKNLILNALILTSTTMAVGFINMGFRVYLSNKIGTEGMGLYQLLMSIYMMAATLAISGIRVTTTRLIAEELGRKNVKKIKSIMKNAIIYSLFFSSLATFLVFYNAELIATSWIGDERAIIPLKILSVSLPFFGVGACFHGYFYGMRKVIKSVTSDIIEISTLMIIICSFISITLPKGLNYTCILVTTANSLSVIISTLFSYIMYIFEKKNINKTIASRSDSCSLFEISKIAIPIASSAYIQTGLRTVEDILIPNALRLYGASTSASLSIFGLIKGMVMPLLNFPSIFLASFSTLIIPEISEANALNQRLRVNSIISRVFKFTLLIAIFASGLFIIYSDELGMTIYNNNEVGYMIRILAPLIPFMYLDRIVDGSLNALDQQMSTLRYNFIDMGIRIFLILFLIPKKGIDGFIIVLFTGTLLNSLLSINRLLKVTKLDFLLLDWIIKPTFCITLSSFCTKFLFNLLGFSSLVFIQIGVVVIFYFIFLLLSKTVLKSDIMWFIDAFKNDIKSDKIGDLGVYKRF
ncbi:oligosaccharide flippase family protein [Clostridium sp. CCUG 7971]|uniref:oligosaccharide flippase family protein n=1 Tax=Clostridium sp. CCUG 7971 TaxID=2811414 RepID=UPI001ABBB634|nr:oligosaccharide flippase family protein [Clostridium sp. CCUG 7971]MBO3445636.1 oligosaccharide flippase family protein [Clostridium sp. CCUG 7971]